MRTPPYIALECQTCGAKANAPAVVEVPGLRVRRGQSLLGVQPTIRCLGPDGAPHPSREMARSNS